MAGTSLRWATSRMGSGAGRWASYQPSAAPLPRRWWPWHVGDPARDAGSRGRGWRDPSGPEPGDAWPGAGTGGEAAPAQSHPWSLRHGPRLTPPGFNVQLVVYAFSRQADKLLCTCRFLPRISIGATAMPPLCSLSPNQTPGPCPHTFPSPCMGTSAPCRADPGQGHPTLVLVAGGTSVLSSESPGPLLNARASSQGGG